ncbi:hypothetical protein MN608_07545 [Microdochium nivale]|nr:hypothetical protein MN608_07545 [Microdochium nivale]
MCIRNLDVSQFKLRDDAPTDVKQLIRPSQLIVASKFGYEISFSDSIASSFDSQYKKAVSAGGSINILGLPISLGASGSSTTEKNTHQADWDAASNTLKVEPKADVQTATVLGVVGEKFSIL